MIPRTNIYGQIQSLNALTVYLCGSARAKWVPICITIKTIISLFKLTGRKCGEFIAFLIWITKIASSVYVLEHKIIIYAN